MKTTGFFDPKTDNLTKEVKYNKKNSDLSGIYHRDG